MDSKDFKQALARFASGVTVVTAQHDDFGDQGMTASAFCSLSLDPPLVLVCIKEGNQSYERVQKAGAFAINILARDQEALSNRFANAIVDDEGRWLPWPADRDKFADIGFARGDACGGAALLDGALAQLECQLEEVLPGGDHGIFVGRVMATHLGEGEPLLYAQGKYRGLG